MKCLTVSYLKEKYKSKRNPIKTVILDQSIIVGIGNIYADEVLFAAKINPLKVGSDITLGECQRIVDSSKKIIEEAAKSIKTIEEEIQKLDIISNKIKELNLTIKLSFDNIQETYFYVSTFLFENRW